MAALVLLALGSGCSSDAVGERLAEGILERASGGEVDIDARSGEVSIRTEDGSFDLTSDDAGNVAIETDEGSFTAGASSEIPPELAAAWTFPDGYVATGSMTMDTGEGASVQSSGSVPGASLADVVAATEAALADGWDVTFSMNADGFHTWQATRGDAESLTVSVGDGDGGPSYTVALIR